MPRDLWFRCLSCADTCWAFCVSNAVFFFSKPALESELRAPWLSPVAQVEGGAGGRRAVGAAGPCRPLPGRGCGRRAGLRAQGPAGASGAAGSCHWFRGREAAEPPVTGTGVRLLHSCHTSDCHQRPGREEGSTVRTPPSPHVRVCVPRAGELGTDAPALLASESAGEPAPCPEGAAGCSLPACPRAASWRPRQCAGQVLAVLELHSRT